MIIKFELKKIFYTTIILSIILSSASIAQIYTKEEWDSAFQANFRNNDPLLDNVNANETGEFSWHAHYWIRAYITMAQTYNETSYLDKAVKLIDFLLFNRDDARYARGELNLQAEPYVSAPLYYLNHRDEAAPGWRILAFGTEWRIQTLDDGQITHAIMRFADCVLNNINFSAYHDKAQEYIAKVEETVIAHNSVFAFNRTAKIPGSYYYPNTNGSGLYTGSVPYNHNATMGVTLLLLDKVKGGVPEYREKAIALLESFKLNAQVTDNNSYVWNYNFTSNPSAIEDFNHAHIDLSFLYLAYSMGLDFSEEEMQRLVNTLIKNIYRGNGELNWFVNGSNDPTQNSYWPIGFDWIDLAEFNPEVFEISKQVYQMKYASPTWARPFLGWAQILFWEENINKEPLSIPEPPKDLHVEY